MKAIVTVGMGDEHQGKALIIHAYEHDFLVIAYKNLDAIVVGTHGVPLLELNNEAAAVYLQGLVQELSASGARLAVEKFLSEAMSLWEPAQDPNSE